MWKMHPFWRAYFSDEEITNQKSGQISKMTVFWLNPHLDDTTLTLMTAGGPILVTGALGHVESGGGKAGWKPTWMSQEVMIKG